MGYNPNGNGTVISPTTDIVANSLTVAGDIEVTTASKGVIRKDANGVRWRETQETDGTIKREEVV
jgi:DUF4097 and DUF4098 domain-containing protein YvlB